MVYTRQSDSHTNHPRGRQDDRNSEELIYPTDRTQSQFLPVKLFRTKCEGGHQERDQLDSKLIGKSEVMRDLKKSIRLVAASSETVLITGESGTGKELIARGIMLSNGMS